MLGALASEVIATLERSRAQAELEALNLAMSSSLEDYRQTAELSPQIPWTADAELDADRPHQRWADLTAVDHDENAGRGWMKEIHPEDLPAVYEALTNAGKTVNTYQVKYRYLLLDGTYRWMRSRAAPGYNEQGQIVRWYIYTEDIHDQEMARIALEESEAHYRWSVELSAQIQWTATADGRSDMVVPRWKALTG